MLALSPHSEGVPPAGRGLSVWSLHILPVPDTQTSSQSKDMQVSLIGDSELPVGVNV